MKKLKLGLYGLVGVLVLMEVGSFVVLRTPNPPERNSGAILSPAGDKILKRSCFDCHSNETQFPWYAYVPPTSLMVKWHIADGRHHLNFSKWDTLTPDKKGKHLQEALEELREGEMPMGVYLITHPQAKVTKEELQLLTNDVATLYGPQYTTKPPHDEEHEHDED